MVRKTKRLEQMDFNLDPDILTSEELDIDGPTPEETEQQQKMADEIYFSDMINQKYGNVTKQEMKIKYRKFLSAVRESGINVEDTYANMGTKIRHLQDIMGYEGLKGKGNKHVPFKNAKSSRIGAAYLKIYNTARKACDN